MNSNSNEQKEKSSSNFLLNIINKDYKPWVSVLITILIMGVLIALVYLFNIPNPNMILIAGLVICSSLFGFGGGITASVIMLGYSLFFFSDNHDFVTFTGQNGAKVLVSMIGIIVDMLFVCYLKRMLVKEFQEVTELSEQLAIDNENLHKASITDTLTGIGNRLALRLDYENYQNHEVCVVLIDIDDFKGVNDNYGHDVGDLMLVMTAKLISNVFGREACYRYGGDEFLVIVADPDMEECIAKIRSLIDKRPEILMFNDKVYTNYSVGYHFAQVGDSTELRDLLTEADGYMYEAKRAGKNRISGDEDRI